MNEGDGSERSELIGGSLSYVLLAHHPPNQLDHTITIKLGNKILYLCARCTGLLFGVIFSIFFFYFYSNIYVIPFPFIFVVCVIPGTLDWIYHNLDRWKSNNFIRVSTGFLLGIPIGFFILSLVSKNHIIFIEFLLLSGIYLVTLLFFCSRYPEFKKHFQDYEEFVYQVLNK
jgi:uncharacterized membrane protein